MLNLEPSCELALAYLPIAVLGACCTCLSRYVYLDNPGYFCIWQSRATATTATRYLAVLLGADIFGLPACQSLLFFSLGLFAKAVSAICIIREHWKIFTPIVAHYHGRKEICNFSAGVSFPPPQSRPSAAVLPAVQPFFPALRSAGLPRLWAASTTEA